MLFSKSLTAVARQVREELTQGAHKKLSVEASQSTLKQIQDQYKPILDAFLKSSDNLVGKPDEYAAQLEKALAKTEARMKKSVSKDLVEKLANENIEAILKDINSMGWDVRKVYGPDTPQAKYIESIFTKMLGDNPEYKPIIHVLDSDVANAFNAGAGQMAVTTGLMKSMKSEAELAGVLAHEMTHGQKAHVLESVFEQDVKTAMSFKAMEKYPLRDPSGIPIARNYDAQEKISQGNFWSGRNAGRLNETEADLGALTYMDNGGYNPHAMPVALKRIGVNGQNQVTEVVETPVAKAIRETEDEILRLRGQDPKEVREMVAKMRKIEQEIAREMDEHPDMLDRVKLLKKTIAEGNYKSVAEKNTGAVGYSAKIEELLK
jgi:predicted Zn-dependent protease